MRQKSLLLATSAILLTAGGVSGWVEPGTAAETRFPTTEVYWWNQYPDYPWQRISFTVPDQDTTVSASGGELRRYDVHIAKMFEVTHYLCQQHNPNYFNWINGTLFSPYSEDSERLKLLEKFLQNKLGEKGFEWVYEAANGNVDMGRFRISCQLAANIATAYGLGKAEYTTTKKLKLTPRDASGVHHDLKERKEYLIPTLNLNKAKTSKWMSFVQSFRPVSFYPSPTLEHTFPIDESVFKLAEKTEIPILLPSHIDSQGDLEVQADRNGYSIDLYEGFWKCGSLCRESAAYRGSITARRIEQSANSEAEKSAYVRNIKLAKEIDKYPVSTFRKIQLSGGIDGFYVCVCGMRCLASVNWKYQGVGYTVMGELGGQRTLVAIANSMIEAGPR